MNWRKLEVQLERRGVNREEFHKRNRPSKEGTQKRVIFGRVWSNQNQNSLCDLLISKERDLDLLIRELDDKVRLGQRGHERPKSGAGEVSEFPDRPSPWSGAFEDSRSRRVYEAASITWLRRR